MEIPKGLSVEVPKNTDIIVSGIDKAKVGQFSAEIRELRKPEPYKGKVSAMWIIRSSQSCKTAK